MRLILLSILVVKFTFGIAQINKVTPLNDSWLFALDPLKVGEKQGWTEEKFPTSQLDKVVVPHSFSSDRRYFFYTGTAWYFRKFDAAVLPAGYRAYLKFDAVFYRSSVWLNGKKAGDHEGGYTPFEIDVTPFIKAKNTLSVRVDNSWDTTTIPGAKTRDTSYRPNASQLYAWMNYGGITKPVSLVIRPEIHIEKVKVFAEPDLKKGTARISVKAFIRNHSETQNSRELKAIIYNGDTKYTNLFKPVKTTITANGKQEIVLTANLPAKGVKLWSHDYPHLYKAEVFIGTDTIKTNFGIRKIEVAGTKILLNGKPIKMGGGNRPADYPGLGSVDPDSILFRDLKLMKSAGMEFSRIAHHAVPESLLNWADKHGMLIITEAGNWQMTTRQMSDPQMREKYKSQLKEMVERDWNHPSVIAYSLGNEFYSQKEEGKAWVRDMKEYVNKLDNTRLVTFASYMAFRDYIKKPEDEASHYVDFISANIYGNHEKNLAKIHEIYPDKPVYISEFGVMLADGRTEEKRIEYFNKAFESIRKADYVVGASVWTFNDYLSRYPYSNPDGYRSWGIVTPERKPRKTYFTLQEEFSPASVELLEKQGDLIKVKVTCRNDFPFYTIKGYKINYGEHSVDLKELSPGQSQVLDLRYEEKTSLTLVKPGGFVILEKGIN